MTQLSSGQPATAQEGGPGRRDLLSLINVLQLQIQTWLSFLDLRVVEPISKSYENSGNSFDTFIIS